MRRPRPRAICWSAIAARIFTEPIVAVIAVANTDDAFGFCGECYRKMSEDFLGHVV